MVAQFNRDELILISIVIRNRSFDVRRGLDKLQDPKIKEEDLRYANDLEALANKADSFLGIQS